MLYNGRTSLKGGGFCPNLDESTGAYVRGLMSVSRVARYGFFACYGLAYQLSVYIQTAPLSGSAVRQTLDMLFCGRGGMFCDLIKVEPARCIRMIIMCNVHREVNSLYRRRSVCLFRFRVLSVVTQCSTVA